MIDSILRKQLQRDEGYSLTAYQDSKGFWTIGIGHKLGAHARMTTITDDECNALFAWDTQVAAEALGRVFGTFVGFALLDAPRMRAMVNMMFNRGEGHVLDSTEITPAIKLALTTGLWQPVHDEIVKSPWCAQIKDRGLRIAQQFLTGVDQ